MQLRAGSGLLPLGAPKQRAVLAMLTMNRNRAVSVDCDLARFVTEKNAGVPASNCGTQSVP